MLLVAVVENIDDDIDTNDGITTDVALLLKRVVLGVVAIVVVVVAIVVPFSTSIKIAISDQRRSR